MFKTLGGDRLGSGKKQKIEMHNYERSTHDLGRIFRSTMSAGTLVPCYVNVALPGDTWDMHYTADVKTHPTIGPLFASFKLQVDTFIAPMRLYNSALHNNMVDIGLNMQSIQFPKMGIENINAVTDAQLRSNIDNCQVNPSSLLAYLGVRGFGYTDTAIPGVGRKFNAIPLLFYWDSYKNYYSNKQETVGYVIDSPANTPKTVTSITIDTVALPGAGGSLSIPIQVDSEIKINYTGSSPIPDQILINTTTWGLVPMSNIAAFQDNGAGTLTSIHLYTPPTVATFWEYAPENTAIKLQDFPLTNIDDVRRQILATDPMLEYVIKESTAAYPYYSCLQVDTVQRSQAGLGIKTYQSDLFNNWLNTDWLDGAGGINEVTAVQVDPTSNRFTLDALILSRKVYDLFNRIAVSGNTYDDWITAVFAHDPVSRAESPMYMGGMSQEVIFDQVVSMANAAEQPLGTLGGRGHTPPHHKKGGNVHIKVNEPSFIMTIASLTPRIDYSQGNMWYMYALNSVDDIHKPGLDGIGFQELITEQMAWWDTHWNGTTWIQRSAGKQPSWINYMTNYNQTYGNFAVQTNEMFMTLNRRYSCNIDGDQQIKDLTTYINPQLYNFVFAQTSLDAQNFWVQIAIDATVRRKMSAKIMPNL